MATVFAGVLLALQVAVPQQGSGPAASPDAVAADTGPMRHANKRTPPLAWATRLASSAPALRIDGRLDDAIWSQARPMTEFSQTAPREGEPATERMDVRIVYDDQAIYVGARMFDSDPGGVRHQ